MLKLFKCIKFCTHIYVIIKLCVPRFDRNVSWMKLFSFWCLLWVRNLAVHFDMMIENPIWHVLKKFWSINLFGLILFYFSWAKGIWMLALVYKAVIIKGFEVLFTPLRMNKNQIEQASAIACTTLSRCYLVVFLYRHQLIIYTAPSYIVRLTPIKFTSDGLSLP